MRQTPIAISARPSPAYSGPWRKALEVSLAALSPLSARLWAVLLT
nr:MAG TPA: hypothetical protein [Caudoviricetes sp.]